MTDLDRRAETTTELYPCLPSLGEPCGNCHRCTDPAETTTALPRPGDGCQCASHTEDRGGGHYELVAEYEPACPEHSEHVWNPRTGMWEHRAETTTATTEDAAQVIESTRHYNGSRSFIVPADAARALMDAGLLASSSPARTRPTREQIAEAVHNSDLASGRSGTYRTGESYYENADAVLALWADQPTEAEAGARAVSEMGDWFMRQGFDRDVTAAQACYERAAYLRGGGGQ